MKVPLLVIGGGLSGLAAAIRAARFIPNVVLLEKHSRLGGLNSYFYKNNSLLETGLHAITNFARPEDRHAPLNKLLRQLKIKREQLAICEQLQSAIVFRGCETLFFNNDINLLKEEVAQKFPNSIDDFLRLLIFLQEYDPFQNQPFQSAHAVLQSFLKDKLLVDMLLCPLMYYGSAREKDMDLDQFAIMFRAIFFEGMFRPRTSIKDFLELLSKRLVEYGGSIRRNCTVTRINRRHDQVISVVLENGEELECEQIISTIGARETTALIEPCEASAELSELDHPRLAFVETIFAAGKDFLSSNSIHARDTILFYNNGNTFSYHSPDEVVDLNSGVICFPQNFEGLEQSKSSQLIRTTHLANYEAWRILAADPAKYQLKKRETSVSSAGRLAEILESDRASLVCEDIFTPMTIERYTNKFRGAIYGSPVKYKDGRFGLSNLYLAGTDQGFLGIVGSMLSGVTIVNQHILAKL